MTDYSPEWLCRRIVADSGDAVIFADRDGVIRLWNTAAAEMFGYTPAEALGRSLDLIITETLRARHNEGYRRVMAEGTSKYAKDLLAVPGLTKDGRRISLEFTITLVRDQAGPNPGRRRHPPGCHRPLAAGPGAEKAPGGFGGAINRVGRTSSPAF